MDMTRMLRLAGIAGFVALITAGCLQKDTTETWYVGATGDVHWVVTEKDVRSDANTVDARLEEESGYWLAVQQQRHPVAMGLQELGGLKARTLVLRGESPFTVQTDARFTGLDELGRRLLASIGAIGTSLVTRDGPVSTWTLTVRDPSAESSVSEPSEGVSALMNDLDKLKVVLIAGRFDAADGFDLSGDRRVATLKVIEETTHEQTEQAAITLRLVWK
jgi:hypothetical protein